MTYRVIISSRNGKFPLKGLNELLNGRLYNFRTKKYHNSVKSENDKVCRLAIQKYMRGVKIDKPIRCTYMIYAGDKRHDRGNLACAVEKSFLDALQEMKVIKNDGFDDVLDSVFHTELCRDNPRIEVIIEEAEGEWVMAGKTFKELRIVLTDETEEEIRDLIEQIERISGYEVTVANVTIVSEIKESDKL